MSAGRAIYLGWNGTPISHDVKELVAARYEIIHARHCAFGEAVDQDALAALRADYLFSFGPVIVRAPLLESLRVAAINFHTAPPEWPGRGSVSFALLHGDTTFGVTAHTMIEAVDQGAILRVHRFPITDDDTVESLDRRAKEAIPGLVEALLDDLDSADGRPVPNGEQWQRPALRQGDLEALMAIPPDADDETVRRTVRAFAHPTKPGPFVERAGFRFWYRGGDSR